MTDEQLAEKIKAPPEISEEEFLRFFHAVLPSARCPTCGNEDLSVVDNIEEDYPVQLATRIRGIRSGYRTLWIVLLVCDSCGFTRHFDRWIVRRWLDENPKSGNER